MPPDEDRMTSMTAPPQGPWMASTGHEDSKMSNVQSAPKSLQPVQPVQTMDLWYDTETESSRNGAEAGMCIYELSCEVSIIKCFPFLQLCWKW